jgi:hypothetical protein
MDVPSNVTAEALLNPVPVVVSVVEVNPTVTDVGAIEDSEGVA